ncbi:alpha-amylase [Flavonifractor sp. An100]|nr:alpha-amylase [Flavonifractor sp. An100]
MCLYQPTYDSRDIRYKKPYGAVPSGTVVEFNLRPPRSDGFSRGWLTARFESWDNREIRLPMPWVGTELGRDQFRATLDTKDYVGLVWYSLTLEGIDGRKRDLGHHQLTVYQPGETVAPWFGEGMTYQIFPDRFCRSRIPDPAGMVGRRSVHQNWEDLPEYRPDPRGEIRNRDFFGGDFKGVLEKLDYLKELGVETLYFNPIFEAAENHRYGTADYDHIDPMLGTNEDFARLCREAHKRGMRVMLDGVFNHTGYVSRYFNGDGFYPEVGASQSWDSPYRPWFNFIEWPKKYESWWGIYSLPAVNEGCPSYRDFIFGSEDSVVRRWLRAGADGWRLDVADELPDDFVHGIHEAARAEKSDAVVIGEVWEDGSTKIAYGVRRKHILGGHCDGLMNYPLRNAILSFFQGGGGEHFVEAMETIRENYPPFAFYSAMNSLGTHDTPRILTLLGAGGECRDQSRDWRAHFRLSPKQRRRGKDLLRAASLLLFCFPGSPTVYYGDEAGMEGFEDPFNRQTYPWGKEDRELVDWFKALGALRKNHPSLRRGSIRYVEGQGPVLAFLREGEGETILCACNAGEEQERLALPFPAGLTPLLGRAHVDQGEEGPTLLLPPQSGVAFLVTQLENPWAPGDATTD